MRVVFLDIDGVLNSERFKRSLEEQHGQLGHHEVCECFKLARQIDRSAIDRLNRLIAATGAKIVISSSWRKLFGPPELHRILSEHGLVAEIVGVTPDGNGEPEMREIYGSIDRVFRGHEIDCWLRRHPEVDRCVILDDESDMAMHKHLLVQTDPEDGLLDDHVEQAIRVMSWDGRRQAILVDEIALPTCTQNRQNAHRWDEIGSYIVSTIKLPAEVAVVTGTQYETLVCSRLDAGWDADGSGVQSVTEAEADAAHDTACTRIRGRIQ